MLEANVLLPFSLRDTLLRAAAEGLFVVCWPEAILDAVSRSLVRTGRISAAQSDRLLAAMRDAFPDALVVGFETLIESMRNDAKDRHVAAAAVRAGADAIVTSNLRVFRRLPDGMRAMGPNAFLLELVNDAPDIMAQVVRSQAAALRRPPVSVERLLVGLGRSVPRFAEAMRPIVLG